VERVGQEEVHPDRSLRVHQCARAEEQLWRPPHIQSGVETGLQPGGRRGTREEHEADAADVGGHAGTVPEAAGGVEKGIDTAAARALPLLQADRHVYAARQRVQ